MEHRETSGPMSSLARAAARDVGLLWLRVGMLALIWQFHMSPKLEHFAQELREFPDPLGIGHGPSFVLALSAEGLGSILVAIGFVTRLAALPIVFTMLVVLLLAARGFEAADVQAACLYALPYSVLVLTGPGRWSIDHRLNSNSIQALTPLRSTNYATQADD